MDVQEEIEILKTIDHPNVARMIDVFEDELCVYVVMEMIEGRTVMDMIEQGRTFSELEVRDTIVTIIDSVQYCHGLEIVHRDINPNNLILKNQELGISTVKITDFGVV